MKILGIDPGTGRIGYGVVEGNGNSCRCLAHGCLTTVSSQENSPRLLSIKNQLEELLDTYSIDGAAVEKLYFSKNSKTAFSTAEARGVILLTLFQKEIPVIEFSPQHVKTGVTGYGHATKRQVQLMVQKLFALEKPPTPDDAADALALAHLGLFHFPKK